MKVEFDNKYEYLVDKSNVDDMIELAKNAVDALSALRDAMLKSCGANVEGREDKLLNCQLGKDIPLIADICEYALVEINNEWLVLDEYKSGDFDWAIYATEGDVLKVSQLTKECKMGD